MDYQLLIKELLPVIREAGKKIMEIYEDDFEVEYKKDSSPLTRADQEANQIIVDFLKKTWPEHAVLSEEVKDDFSRLGREWCWIVDPLDGTKEFVKRNGEFTVNIALSKNQKSVLGMIHVPVTGELYYAYKQGGAFYQTTPDNKFEQIEVSNKTEELCLVMSRSHASAKLQNLINKNKKFIQKSTQAGSSLKGCLVARGEADIYYRFNPTMEWDTAALQIIVEEAGGIVEQLDGSPLLYNRKDSLNAKGFYVLNRRENNFLKDSKQ
ncbi:MAG: 3'(2'),5'-bisphosphate nucleotidase CysQ [Myxococcota bacterium]